MPLSPELSSQARNAMILPGLKSASLISIGELCNDGCNILLSKWKLIVVKNKGIILEGNRNYSDGFWDISIHKTSISKVNYTTPQIHPGIYPHRTQAAVNITIINVKKAPTKQDLRLPRDFRYFDDLIQDNIDYLNIKKQINKDALKYALLNDNLSISVIIHKKNTHTELAQYLHAACFPPVKSTFLKAIKRQHFKIWPGLTTEVVNHLPKSVSTVQDHLHLEW